MRGILALGLAALLLSGCASGQYAPVVASFKEVTDAAVDAQNSHIEELGAEDTERLSQQLAEDRADLRITEACADLAFGDAPVGECQVVRFDGEPLDRPFTATHVIALGRALKTYAAGLAALAADSTADTDAFEKEVGKLALALGKLTGELDKIADSETFETKKLTAFGTIAGEVGGLALEQARLSALKRIILAADPIVQDATSILAVADEALRLDGLGDAFDEVLIAEEAVSAAIAGGESVAVIRKRQDTLFEKVDELKKRAAMRDGFAGIGAAHASLADSVRRGGSLEDLKKAMERILESASVVASAVEVLQEED